MAIPLKTIAEILTAIQINYAPGKCEWNRSHIQRMIDDRRYMGNGGYPPILTEEQFTSMQTLKDEKNTQKDTDCTTDIFKLNTPVICSRCGGIMKRWYDKRRKTASWWVCGEYKSTLKINDEILLGSITELLNTVIADPDRIRIPESTYKESQEIKRMNAEIFKTLDTFGFDKEAVKPKMLD